MSYLYSISSSLSVLFSCCAFNLAQVKACVKHFLQKCSENMYFPNFQIWHRGWLKLKKGLKMPNFPAAGYSIHSLQNSPLTQLKALISPTFLHHFHPSDRPQNSPPKTLGICIVFLPLFIATFIFHPFQKSFLHFALHCDILYISLK